MICFRRKWTGRLCLVVALLSLAVPGGRLRAQATALGVELESSSSVSRTGGPISLGLRFDWRGSSVLDGRLLIEVHDTEDEVVGTFVLDDLYLTEGLTRQEIMLPGINVYNDELVLEMRLQDTDGRDQGRLKPALLRIPGNGRRSLVIAVFRPESAGRRGESDVIDALRLEALFPDYHTQRSNTIVTRSVDVSPEDAPAEPLRLCTFDVVLLTGDALTQLSKQQLGALLAWTRAGGAVCLLAEGESLDARQLDFVNALIGSDADDPVFLLDSSGRLVYGAGEEVVGPLKSRCGLGRAVIVGLDGESDDASAAHWPQTSAFLWRLRQEHLKSVAASNVWDIGATLETVRKSAGDQPQYNSNWQFNPGGETGNDEMLKMQATDMTPVPIGGGTGLLTRLMPGDIRIVPLWLIGIVLLCYVGAIGPLDYLVLGRLGLRRLTWVSFPVMTLVFTISSIVLSNSFLNVAAERKALTIRDVDDQGSVIRENRLELLFPSRSRTMETDVGRGLFCPQRHQDFSRQAYYYGPYGYQMWNDQRAEPASFIGRMPTRTTVIQRIGQWTPQLNRTLTIPLTAETDAFAPLADPKLKDLIRIRSHGVIVQHLKSSVDNLAGVYLYGLGEFMPLDGPSSLFESSYDTYNRVYVNGQIVSRRIDFLQDVSVRRQPGFFGVVSQISPTGGYRFEDLALVDSSDPQQWLLIVAVEENTEQGRQLVIYRKLYVLDD